MRGFKSRSGLSRSMFKKTALSILTPLLLTLVLGTRPAFSQETTFEKIYQDYIEAQTTYGRSDSDYQKAKGFYLKNQTLALKEDARKKTLATLVARDELVKAYLGILRAKIVELKGLSQEEQAVVLEKVDPEIAWYEVHAGSYQDSDSLENLFNKSKEAESRYKNETPVVIYDSFLYISIGEVAGLKLSHEEVYSSLKEILNKGVSEGKLTADPFDKWLKDIDGVLVSLKINEAQVKSQEEKLFRSGIKPGNVYPSVVEPFLHSTALLKQLNSYLTEFLTSLNIQLK